MKIDTIKIGRINAAPYNPRIDLKPSDPEYQAIARSLDDFGLVEPLVWNKRTGHLVGGHQRFKILKAKGNKALTVSIVDLPIAEERILNVTLNKASGRWSYPTLKELLTKIADGGDATRTGFTADEIADMTRGNGVGEDDDIVPSKPRQSRVRHGEIWACGDHRVICGDSTKDGIFQEALGKDRADFCVTSPPYNVGIAYKTFKDKKPRDEYLKLIRLAATSVFSALDDGMFCAWNIGVSPQTFPHRQSVCLEDAGFEFYRQIIWEKSGIPYPVFPTTLRTKRARKFTPNYKHEVINIFEKPGGGKPGISACPLCDGSGKAASRDCQVANVAGNVVLVSKGEPNLGETIHPLKEYQNDVWHISQSSATRDIKTMGTRSSGLDHGGKKANMVKEHPAVSRFSYPGP